MIDAQYLEQYATDRGREFDYTPEQAGAAILQANEYLEAYYSIDDDRIAQYPDKWDKAQAEAALLQLAGSLMPEQGTTTGELIEESGSVGPLSETLRYAEGSEPARPRVPYLNKLMRPLVKPGGGRMWLV